MKYFPPLLILVSATTSAVDVDAPSRAVMFDPLGSPHAQSVVSAIEAAGYEAYEVAYTALAPALSEGADRADLLVLPNGATLPMDSAATIEAYLKSGGDILALNTPMWRTPLVRLRDEWVDRETYRETRGPALMQSELYTFSGPDSIRDWQRSTSNPAFEATHVVEADPAAPGGYALHVRIDDIDSWDTYMPPPRENVFPEGHTLTVFYAKGDANTPALSLEWTERDQSRWIAVVPLSAEWRCYVLQPSDFHFWESDPARKDTQFDPAHASQLRVGLAFSHTPIPAGPHEYWLGTIGTGARTVDAEPLLTHFTPPVLETLSPGYKFFMCNDVRSLVNLSDPSSLPASAQGAIRSPHPRPRAAGFDKGRAWRFEPLLEARAHEGSWRGNPATLLAHADGPYKGGVWASIGIEDPGWYARDEARVLLTSIASRMREGIFLLDGGASYYTYFENQPVSLGARVLNTAAGAQDVELAVALTDAGGSRADEHVERVSIGPLAVTQRAWECAPLSPENGTATARVEVRRDGRVLDRASHEVHGWRPKDQPEFIEAVDGNFVLRGERWRAHGVNYMPSSGIGTEDWSYFEHWIGARAYDPEIVQRDLDHIHDMGMNAVSIFVYHESLDSQNLLDLLRRLDGMGMKANLSLRPGTPMDFEWEKIRELLEYYRIAEHDCVFALDLAWEPMFPNHEGRKRYDVAWREWVEERYGSIDNAVKDWQFDAPRDDAGNVTNPTDTMVTEDGPWRVYVAAYRRFLDTLLYVNYNRAREFVRSVDPHHLVSFRMTEAGDPTFRGTSVLPYDFPYLAAAVDILEPEGYGRIGDWEVIEPAIFEAEYGRWAAPNLPFMWAEAGVHVWDSQTQAPLPERLAFQADYYSDVYRMLIETGADGIFWWWYPGGYRVNERSDYGILEPDGTDRPVSKVIRKHAQSYLEEPDLPEPDSWLTIDRDAHPSGVPGIYESVRKEYWNLRDQNRVPGLKTDGTGTDSATCPLIAVGNVPCTGSNPAKYLDAYFERVEMRDATGAWVTVDDGASVADSALQQVALRCTIVNLGEATWRSGQGPGNVVLNASSGGRKILLPTHVSRHQRVTLELALERLETDVILAMEATGRTTFGDRFRLKLR